MDEPIRIRGTKLVCEIPAGADWRLLPDGRTVVVHPDLPAYVVHPDGRVEPIPPPPGPASSYMTTPPGADRDSLGRPWPDVQVQPRKPRRRQR